MQKKIYIIFLILIVLIIILFSYKKNLKSSNLDITDNQKLGIEVEEKNYSNIIKNVQYVGKDEKGNGYIIIADEGEIDIKNTDIIFLKNVKAEINLKNSNKILIFSDFGKYNIKNFDTIFSKNIIIKYLKNTINGEYLELSITNDSMTVSKDVIYKNESNILKADVMEMKISTKDTKIFMYEDKKKVLIESLN